jgi:hypothetical protein
LLSGEITDHTPYKPRLTAKCIQNRLSALGLADTLMVAVEHAQEHLLVLHAMARVHLARYDGFFYRSAVALLHERLMTTYQHADTVVRQLAESTTTTASALINLRNQLAGLWCLYAHFLCEVGVASSSNIAATSTRTTSLQQRAAAPKFLSSSSSPSTPRLPSRGEWQIYALSILSVAVQCPLVGTSTLSSRRRATAY